MPIYQSLLQIIQQYLYGTVNTGSWEELTSIILASIGCIMLVALPFIAVWAFIKAVINWGM